MYESSKRTALVTVAAGIGDVIRVTPLIRLLYRLGYEVDVLALPDDPSALELLRGAVEISHLLSNVEDLVETSSYDIATFTHWTTSLQAIINARQYYAFGRNWYTHGDTVCLRQIAGAIGWRDPLPPPFAMKSNRNFHLAKGTVAIHPGCKPTWPWKRWHGFEGLAAMFKQVAIVGTSADINNVETYFKYAFKWPHHARNYTDLLILRDTAALISQCSALIALDSGLMHLGVALQVPTFGIFGITNPARECMESRYMTFISKELPCESSCRLQRWGRRNCQYHLHCLKSLSPEDVYFRMRQISPKLLASLSY